MRYAVVAAALAGAASADWSPPAGYSTGSWGESSAAPVVSSAAPVSSAPAQYTTEVVTAYTTYCPEATKITLSGVTYTATEATTLTITNCPGGCTISYPTSSASPVTTSVPITYSTTLSTSAVVTPYPAPNSTVPYSTAAPIPVGTTATSSYGSTGSPIASAPPATGGAAKSYSAVGAAIAAIFGLVASL